MKIDLPRWIHKLEKWCEGSPRWSAADGIAITVADDTATAVATDCRRMAVVRIRQLERTTSEGTCIVSAADLAKAMKAAGCSRSLKIKGKDGMPEAGDRPAHVLEEGGAAQLVATDTGDRQPLDRPAGRFPPWRQVEETYLAELEAAGVVKVQPQFLAEFAELAKAAGEAPIEIAFINDPHAGGQPSLVGRFTTPDGCSCSLVIVGMGEPD